MAGELILITGGTGHIGYAVATRALEVGYRLRLAIRRESAIHELRATPSFKPYIDQLDFVLVPDISANGAYDAAVKEVDHIFHLASPLAAPVPEDQYQTLFFRPAVNGTINLLEAANMSTSVKRVVIATSAAILKSLHGDTGTSTADDVVQDSDGPFENFFHAYQLSKVKAWYATKKWLAENEHSFEVTQLYPSFVLGTNPLVNDLNQLSAHGSSSFLTSFLLGNTIPLPLAGTTVHLDDVAELFIKAIDYEIPGNQHWIANSQDPDGQFEWESAKDIVKKRFPDAVERGKLSLKGSFPTIPGVGRLDNTVVTKTVPGFHWKSFEEQVASVVEQILALQA